MDTHSPEINDVSRPVATNHDDEPCTVSVPEASELFATAALPRTERAIQRFCKKGELKCAFVETPFGSKYLIARSSIDRLIVQKKQAQRFAPVANSRDLPRPDATHRDQSRQTPEATSGQEEPDSSAPQVDPHKMSRDTPGNEQPRQGATSEPNPSDLVIERLRGEIFDLKVDNAGKQNFIRQLVADRTQLMGEVKQISYELGAAQTRVAQLEAPKVTYDMSRPDATVVEEFAAPSEAKVETDATRIAPTPMAPERPAPEQRRAWWRR